MNTYVFDEAGKCLMQLNYFAEQEDFESNRRVVHSNVEHDPNHIWFDYENNRLDQKTPFQEVVTTNTISNLPAGTILEIAGLEAEVDDGEVTIEVGAPQTVRVGLRHVRHHHKFVEVQCEVQA